MPPGSGDKRIPQPPQNLTEASLPNEQEGQGMGSGAPQSAQNRRSRALSVPQDLQRMPLPCVPGPTCSIRLSRKSAYPRRHSS